MASLDFNKILKIALIFFIALFVLTFIIEFLYPILKSGSVDIASFKWIANFSSLSWFLWIVFLWFIEFIKQTGKIIELEGNYRIASCDNDSL